MTYHFDATLWKYTGTTSAWYFVTLPFDVADEIEDVAGSTAGGFGSVRVSVTVGTSTWKTSLFPDNKQKSYVFPINKAVRAANELDEGSVARFAIELSDD